MVHDLSCILCIVALAKFIAILPVPVQRSPAICLLLFHLNGHLCNICQLRIKYGLMIQRRFDFSGKLRSRPMNVGISTKSSQIFCKVCWTKPSDTEAKKSTFSARRVGDQPPTTTIQIYVIRP